MERDLKNTALLIIDIQKGIQKLSKFASPNDFKDVLTQNKKLVNLFELRKLPIYFVSVEPKVFPKKLRESFGELVLKEEFDKGSNGYRVVKYGPSAFTQSDYGLSSELKIFGIDQLVITGITTSNGVYKTALDGIALGFNVFLVKDACTDIRRGSHQKIVQTSFPKIGKVVSTQDIIEGKDI